MKTAEQLFSQSITYWPIQIDISDGKLVSEVSGFKSENLSAAWDNAEIKAKGNEWDELCVWIIFKMLHQIAIKKIEFNNLEIRTSELNFDLFKKILVEELQQEGYKEMFEEIKV